jgi:hypothetical protein
MFVDPIAAAGPSWDVSTVTKNLLRLILVSKKSSRMGLVHVTWDARVKEDDTTKGDQPQEHLVLGVVLVCCCKVCKTKNGIVHNCKAKSKIPWSSQRILIMYIS